VFDCQQLITTDADLRVTDAHDVFAPEGATVDPPIEDHEVIAQPVHLDEGPAGVAGRLWPDFFRAHCIQPISTDGGI
jgi:hypothetical protein